MNIKICLKDENTTWDDLANLLHESFEERLQQGLHFSCSYLTAEDLKKRSANSIVLTAIDIDSGNLAGTVSFDFYSKNNCCWAYHYNLAISPRYKRHGIATLLLDAGISIARERGCEYINSDTAVGAKSSVKWHKKNGFRIIGINSWAKGNYYSYIFRKQLVFDKKWSNPIYCRIHYYLSALKWRLGYKKNGEATIFFKCYRKILYYLNFRR